MPLIDLDSLSHIVLLSLGHSQDSMNVLDGPSAVIHEPILLVDLRSILPSLVFEVVDLLEVVFESLLIPPDLNLVPHVLLLVLKLRELLAVRVDDVIINLVFLLLLLKFL